MNQKFGVYPLDFILEAVIKSGLAWFRSDLTAPDLVFGQLDQPYLARYGTDKINELKTYITETDIKVVQSFSMIDERLPTISIQLSGGSEDLSKTALDDAMEDVRILDMNGDLEETEEIMFSPITESILIGIHAGGTPDLPKYLYMLVVYILTAYKYDLMAKGIYLGTFNMTDLSRLNEYLPENIYTRFLTFTASSNARIKKGSLPQLDIFVDAEVENNEGTEIIDMPEMPVC